jgi:signal transduction histidine kinase
MEHVYLFRLNNSAPFTPPFFYSHITEELTSLESARKRLLFTLITINIGILASSGMAGYFLAGRTLKPIKQMVEEQNRFVTDASHELNTPLTALKTSIEVSLRDKKLTAKKAREILQSNLEEVDSLQLLSNDLIKLTQYQKTNGSMLIKAYPLHTIIAKAVEKVSPLSYKKHIHISFSIPPLRIEADERSLTELFIILLDNAIKYSKDETTITITAMKTDGKVSIALSDQGIGIKKEDVPYIFDRFFRSDKSRSKQTTIGYGLGLSIAKRIVAIHNGTITVKSIEEKGTTFTIILPHVKEETFS